MCMVKVVMVVGIGTLEVAYLVAGTFSVSSEAL